MGRIDLLGVVTGDFVGLVFSLSGSAPTCLVGGCSLADCVDSAFVTSSVTSSIFVTSVGVAGRLRGG